MGGLHGFYRVLNHGKDFEDLGHHVHTPWQQAWMPLMIDVEFEFYPESEHWHLGEHDFERNPGHEMMYDEP